MNGLDEIVQVLLAKNADSKILDLKGNSLISLAILNGHASTLDLLINWMVPTP